MRKIRALLVLNLKAMLCSFHIVGKKKTRAASGVGALIFIAGLSLYLSGLYSFLFASQLAAIHMLPLLLMMMPVLAVAAGTLFTLFAAQGIIFGGKDNDLMLSLPISAFTLMLSRTLALYLENLIFSIFVMIPAGAAYLLSGGGGGVYFVLSLLLCTLFLALLPTLIAFVGGYILSWFSSKFRKHNLLSIILYLTFFVLTMVGMMRLNLIVSDLASHAAGIEQTLSAWCIPFLLLKQAVCDRNLLSLLGFLGLCLLPFLAVVWLFARRYQPIITRLTACGARSDYKLVSVGASSSRRALFRKETRRFFGNPTYLMNAGSGLLLLLLAGGSSLVMRGKLLDFLKQMNEAGVALPLTPLVAGCVLFLLSTVTATASCISLEGKQLWILKEAPVSVRDLFTVKVGFQLSLVLPCLVVSLFCLGFAFSLPLQDVLVIFGTSVAFSLLTALLGLFVNLCFPRLDAPNDIVVVKQSAAVMISLFGSMFLVLLGVGLYFLVQGTVGILAAMALCALLFALGAGLFLWLLLMRGKQLFDAL